MSPKVVEMTRENKELATQSSQSSSKRSRSSSSGGTGQPSPEELAIQPSYASMLVVAGGTGPPSPVTQPVSPERFLLRQEVYQLRDALGATWEQASDRAEWIIAQQREGFHRAATQYEAQARENTQIQIANQTARLRADLYAQEQQANALMTQQIAVHRLEVEQHAEKVISSHTSRQQMSSTEPLREKQNNTF